ncbi:MAG TPA: hypothetical protein VK698_39510 [Kofleriaceae bacterium]|nr:hypothetical protein [Kofleriaceae bacterium]
MSQRNAFEAFLDRIESRHARQENPAGSPGALAGGMTIEALPTVYRGTTFRSALEASWACTLDELNVAWEYEPQTIDLPSGARYIPDFWLPLTGTWIEVKGPGVPRIEKAYELGSTRACDCHGLTCDCPFPGGELVLIGHPPKSLDTTAGGPFNHWPLHSLARLRRRHGGHPTWTSTRRSNAWLTRCPDCAQVTWFDSPCCRACRGPLAGAHGASSGDPDFTFHRVTGPRADTDDPEEMSA